MSSMWGNNIKISIFGESHSEAIGGVLDGLPSGIPLDFEEIMKDMNRRRPGKDKLSTPRSEEDIPNILSGYFNGYTTGTPLSFIIENKNKKSKDYDLLKDIMRPSHGDYTGKIRYQGYNDYRGGGHFSGRLTAPLVFMGAVAKQYLKDKGVFITSRIKSIGHIEDRPLDEEKGLDITLLKSFQEMPLPTVDRDKAKEMEELILQMKSQGDSIGGVVECIATGVPVGLGSPMFDSFESTLSQLLFAVPAVKGVQFGHGFDITRLPGSLANDEMYFEGNKVRTFTNHNGGILGGITNGMPIVFSVAIKPTPSISKEQKTVNFKTNKNESLSIKGRHDPCIVPRVLPVIEACTALNILDHLLEVEGLWK